MFKLIDQKSKLQNINVRAKKHGDDNKIAADLKFSAILANDVLSEFDPSLKSALYRKDLDATQGQLDINDASYLSAIKFPNMGEISWELVLTDYDFVLHYGIGGRSDIRQVNCVVDKFRFMPKDGGYLEIGFRVIAHPQAGELGRMCELIQEEVNISLTPPAQQEELEAA